MVKPVSRKASTKNPPILSHEFVIQNHADIVSCVAMVFVIGLMVQATTPVASIFIALQHNVTEPGEIPLYTSGFKDWAAVFFYTLICIVIHAIIQEYALDKISKRLHLSKSKLAVFNTSGQLAIFYAISMAWGCDIVWREKLVPNVSAIWADYAAPMSFMLKLFLIIQIAYSLHEIPELYFQRTKKEEYASKAFQSLASLFIISVPYFLNFNRLLVSLLVLHYTSEFIIHTALLIQTMDKDDKFTKVTRLVSNAVMVATRIISIILAVLTLWFGLAQGEQKEFDIATGYYNTPAIRLGLLAAVLILQIYLTAVIISRELQKVKEAKLLTVQQKPKSQKKEKSKKSKKPTADESDLPEVDQNTNKNLRNRAVKTK